jgi:hypothetical protein
VAEVPSAGEPVANLVASAAARTVAAGTARVFAAWTTGSPVPEAPEQRWEGVADLAGRRAHFSHRLFFTDEATAAISEPGEPGETAETEMAFDGASMYVRVGDAWTVFFPVDRDCPRGPNDPLWPLDAMFGANDEAVLLAAEAVRGVATTRYRITVDLARADAALLGRGSSPGRARVLARQLTSSGCAASRPIRQNET